MIIEVDDSVLVDAFTALYMDPQTYARHWEGEMSFEDWVNDAKIVARENLEDETEHEKEIQEYVQHEGLSEAYENDELELSDYIKLMLKFAPEAVDSSLKIIKG